MEATLNKNENYTWKFVKKTGNIMEFCHLGKMGTLNLANTIKIRKKKHFSSKTKKLHILQNLLDYFWNS